MKKIGVSLVLFLFVSVCGIYAQDQNNFEISKNVEIYVDILRQLNLNYADDIKPGELNKTAIDALLEKLDPYTVYVPESKLEDFELMTKGEYGGIGALIQKQDDFVVITEPYEGFPAQKAGLKAGDKIIAVDGESAKGKKSAEVSEKLKGVPGSTLSLTIQSYGDTIRKNVEIVREKVKIPNIPYYGILKDNIGYISLTQFNPNAAAEVKKAFVELKTQNDLKGIILDLRSNGGGLLSEAVDITNIFVPKGTAVVTTKGKLAENVQTHRTRFSAVDTKIPLVVLVNENSASASEIVTGAIQDLDRGVIIGQRTFGKGLVQNIVSLPYNARLKMTIAKYYIPSGRCIQAIDYFDKKANGGRPDRIPDSLISEFKTADGRLVYDGGGITPDIETEKRQFSQITGDLYAQNYFFKFANDFALDHDSIQKPADFEIGDTTYEQFKNFVIGQDFSYLTETENLIERLRSSAEREGYISGTSILIDSLETTVRKEKLDEFISASREFLKAPNIKYFFPTKCKLLTAKKLIDTIDRRGSSLVFIKFASKPIVPDVLWGQLYKSKKALRKLIIQHEFTVLRDDAWSNEKTFNVFVFELENHVISSMKHQLGPPLHKRLECEKFLQKHVKSDLTLSGPRIEKRRWVVDVKRNYTDAVKLLKDKLAEGGKREGVADIVVEAVDSLQVFVNDEILNFYVNNSDFAEFLAQFLDGKPVWLS